MSEIRCFFNWCGVGGKLCVNCGQGQSPTLLNQLPFQSITTEPNPQSGYIYRIVMEPIEPCWCTHPKAWHDPKGFCNAEVIQPGLCCKCVVYTPPATVGGFSFSSFTTQQNLIVVDQVAPLVDHRPATVHFGDYRNVWEIRGYDLGNLWVACFIHVDLWHEHVTAETKEEVLESAKRLIDQRIAEGR